MKRRIVVEALLFDLKWGHGYAFEHNGCDGGPGMHPENIAIPDTLHQPIGIVLAERCEEANALSGRLR